MELDHRERLCIALPDGRRVGYAEYGDTSGSPVLFCHGFPGTRLEARHADAFGAALGLRLLAVDRPGIGFTDPVPMDAVGDWALEAARVADALGVGSFAVLGVSGGAPYSLACAALMPDRVTSLHVVGGLGPLPDGVRRQLPAPHRLLAAACVRWPRGFGRIARRLIASIVAHPEFYLRVSESVLPPADAAMLEGSAVPRSLTANFAEAVRSGEAGVARELELFGRDWGFALEEIDCPVVVWHGEADVVVPLSVARHIVSRIERARAVFLPREGHFSVFPRYTAPILRGALED
jgi:pimeloyl-ACP methyl ester carboxylesterase